MKVLLSVPSRGCAANVEWLTRFDDVTESSVFEWDTGTELAVELDNPVINTNLAILELDVIYECMEYAYL